MACHAGTPGMAKAAAIAMKDFAYLLHSQIRCA
jgi:hypothetical protein